MKLYEVQAKELFAQGGIHRHLVFPGRDNPGHNGDERNKNKQDGIRAGKFEFAHDVLRIAWVYAARRHMPAGVSRRVSLP